MRPHPCSGTSLLASYKEVPPWDYQRIFHLEQSFLLSSWARRRKGGSNLNHVKTLRSPNPEPISKTKNCHFPHPFSYQTSKQTLSLRNYVIITLIRTPNKRFLKIHFEFVYYSFFLGIHLELKQQIRSYTPVVPSETIPDSRPKWAKIYNRFQTPPPPDLIHLPPRPQSVMGKKVPIWLLHRRRWAQQAMYAKKYLHGHAVIICDMWKKKFLFLKLWEKERRPNVMIWLKVNNKDIDVKYMK